MLIDIIQVSQRLGVSRSTCERLRRNPATNFPRPIQIGPNSVRYDTAELERWIDVQRQVEAS